MKDDSEIKKITLCPICKSAKKRLKYKRVQKGITSYIYICLNCNFVYNGIKLKNKNAKILDDKFVEGYIKKKDFIRWEKLYNHKLSKIERFMKKNPKKLNMLDIGCGPGALISAAKKRGWKETGIEPFIKSYKLAKRKKLNVKDKLLKQANFPESHFDLITAVEVIEHFEFPLNEFKWIKRVLKKDGLIVIQTANIDSLTFKIKKSKAPYFYYDHLSYYSPKTLKSILDRLDLEIVKIVPDEINLFHRLRWCNTMKEKLKWILFYIARGIVFNKPLLGSMTVYIKNVNKE